jgi:hypothetical protein
MERTPVTSSSLKSVGYDPQTHKLEIEYTSGGVYQYLSVPKEEVEGLLQAESLGRYFLENIRDVYEYRKIS